MFKLFDSGLCPIGIDAGSHAVHMAQFRTSGARGGLKLQAACRIELDSLDGDLKGAARVAAAVRHALASEDFSGKEVVLSLPASCINAKSVRLPQMPDSDLSQALHWEAKDRFGFEVGDGAAVDGGAVGQLVWFRSGEVRRGTEVKDEILLFAVEGGVLTEYIQCLAGLGLKLRAVDIAPCAAYRSLRRGSDSSPGSGLKAHLDLGHVGAQFFITRGEDLVFYKHIDIGGKTINQAVASKLGITVPEALQMRARILTPPTSTPDSPADDAAPLSQAVLDATRAPLEELARELDMCMRYYVVTFRDARPEMISIAGRQAGFAHVRENLAATLGLQVEEAQPFRGVAELGNAARPDRSGEWAVAAGLSLYPLKSRSHAGVAA